MKPCEWDCGEAVVKRFDSVANDDIPHVIGVNILIT